MSIGYFTHNGESAAVITYTMDDALKDGVLVLLGEMGRFDEKGAPLRPMRLAATRTVRDFLGAAGTDEVVQEFCRWYNDVRLTLPEDDRTFEVERKGKLLWLIDHPEGFTLMFPDEY